MAAGGWLTERAPGRRAIAAGVLALAAAGLLGTACSSDDAGGDGETTAGTDAPVVATGAELPEPIGPPDEPGPPNVGGRLVFGLESEPDGLDPARSTFDASGHTIASAVYDPLATIDASGEAAPYLAEAFEHNEDYTEWRIVLREGVRFHDGEVLDAEALALNFDYWTESFVTQGTLTSLESYEPVDERTLAVTMNQPWAAFPYVLSTQTGYVAAPAFLQSPQEAGPSFEAVGTGPFEFRSVDPGSSVTVARNDDYWQEGLPYLDEIQFSYLPDPQNRVEALERGDIDLLHGYQPAILDTVIPEAEAGELKVVANGTGEEDVIAINTDAPPFDDPVARQALAHATDADAWRAVAESEDLQSDVRGPFVPGQLGYSEDDAYQGYDLDRAKELAAEYEAANGEPITAELLTADLVVDQELAGLLTEQWAEAGIDVTVRTAPAGRADRGHRALQLPAGDVAQLRLARPGRGLLLVALVGRPGAAAGVDQRVALRRRGDRRRPRRGPRHRGPRDPRRGLPDGGASTERGRRRGLARPSHLGAGRRAPRPGAGQRPGHHGHPRREGLAGRALAGLS